MANSTTSSVYINVVEDVINKVRDEFVGDVGPGEGVLAQLQATWEMKLIQVGAVLGPIERSSAPEPAPGGTIAPVHDLNVPYEGTEEYETPTAEMLFPPTPLQTPIPTPHPGTADNSMYNIPTGQSDYSENNNDAKGGRPSPYMQASSPWMNQRHALDVNVAYEEAREETDGGIALPATQDFINATSGKRMRVDLQQQYHQGEFIPQQDGAGDAAPGNFELEIVLDKSSYGSDHQKGGIGQKMAAQREGSSSIIPQLDGPTSSPYNDVLSTPNIYNYQGAVNEDYNVVNTPAPDMEAGTPVPPPQNDAKEDDDDEESLNENDDDDEDDLDEVNQGEELSTQNLVLAQFEKVTRAKSRWKCILKDGIMHINGKDFLFNKGNGEFDFALDKK